MTRLLLVDDHAVVREGMKRILTGAPDIVVAGEAEHAQEVYEALAADAFDMVLLDVSLPQHSGLEILTHLHTAYPDLPVLIFSVHPERQYVVRALQEGAAGYLLKSSAPRELVTAIRQIAQGERYVSAELVNHLIHEVAGTEKPLHAAPIAAACSINCAWTTRLTWCATSSSMGWRSECRARRLSSRVGKI